jgi:hypothetical protein
MSLLQLFRVTPQERLDLAIARAAKLQGDEVAAARMEADFYADALKGVDPQVDWWRFANLKQKREDALQEYNAVVGHANVAIEYVESLL